MHRTIFILSLLFLILPAKAQPKHEVRAAWITAVYGLDWPRTRATTHTLRDDARRILPERPQGVVQRPPIFLTAAGRVLPEPERQAVDLHIADIRLQRITAD